MNKSKVTFYKKYDGGQQNGIEFLDVALKEMAECEMEHYQESQLVCLLWLALYDFHAGALYKDRGVNCF